MHGIATILVIDDDRFIQKVIDRTLSQEGFEIAVADDGASGVERARECRPSIIILDVEMPGMNGFETCEILKQDPETESIPVVFLSSHTDLRSRMQGYDAGAADYLSKPFEAEDLVAKMRVLWAFVESQLALKAESLQAARTAHAALSASSELSIAMGFVETSSNACSLSALADAVIATLGKFGLDIVLTLSDDDERVWFASDGEPTPLERDMLQMADPAQRFIDFGMRTIVNFQNANLLVRNMPLDDMERYGRLKDVLPLVMSAANNKVNSIRAESVTAAQSLEIIEIFGGVRQKLFRLAKSLIEAQQQSTDMLNVTVTELNQDLLGMGLEEDQEQQILNRLDQAIAKVGERIDSRADLYSVFKDVLSSLKTIAAHQEELHNVFVQMNTQPVQETEIDDGIELF